jgi:hypothetical protein
MSEIRNHTMNFGFGRTSRMAGRLVRNDTMNFGFGRTSSLTCPHFRGGKLACAEVHRAIAHSPRLRHG